MSTPVFSICHATARTTGWMASRQCWLENADDIQQVEYVLSVHVEDFDRDFLQVPLVVYGGKRDSVTGWNHAASISTGQILILNADDFFPPPHWDSLLLDRITGDAPPECPICGKAKLSKVCNGCGFESEKEFAIHVSTGNPDTLWDRRLMALGIISRPLYKKWGYALYPEYESMDSDVDMTEHAYQDGLVIEAFDLVFEHRHPAFGKAEMDEVYRKQNRPEAYALGHKVLERRRTCRFAK